MTRWRNQNTCLLETDISLGNHLWASLIQAGMYQSCSNGFQSAQKSFPTFFSAWGKQIGKESSETFKKSCDVGRGKGEERRSVSEGIPLLSCSDTWQRRTDQRPTQGRRKAGQRLPFGRHKADQRPANGRPMAETRPLHDSPSRVYPSLLTRMCKNTL